MGAFGAMAGLLANTLDQGQRDAQERAMARLRASGMAEDTEEKQYNFAQVKKQDAAREKMLNDPSLPPEVKQALQMGASPADVMKIQNQRRQGQVESLLMQVPDNATRQKIWAAMQGADPSLIVTPNVMKLLGIGEKTERPFQLVDRNSGAPVFWTPGTPVPPNAVPEQVYASQHKSENDTETPIPLGDITTVGGKTGYWARTKGGAPNFVGMPGAIPKAAARKPLTPAAMNAITKRIDAEWAIQPYDFTAMASGGSGARERAFYDQRKQEILQGMGYDESGQPFEDGQVIGTTPDGKPLIWKNP